MLHTLALLLSALSVQSPQAPIVTLCGDWNADGREDLLLVDGGRLRLFENGAGSGLREVTVAAGLERWSDVGCVLWEDLDGDGAADLLLARAGGDGALLGGLARGGWQVQAQSLGLDLARPLNSVRRAGTALMLEGPDGLRLASFEAGRGWQELALEPTPGAPSVIVEAKIESPAGAADGARPEHRAPLAAAPGSVGVGGVTSSALLPPLNGICAGFIEDQATGTCLPASSLPILGTIYPLSVNWNVTQTGLVGIGTTTPAAKLEVVGDVRAQQFVSTAGVFTAPLVVASSVKVSNLNADKLDGIDSSAFSQLGPTIEGNEISLATITADRLASPLTASGIGAITLRATASGLGASALSGTASGGTGNMGVRGESTSTSGLAYGVRGLSASTSGVGVTGAASATTGSAYGVFGSSTSPDGAGVRGESSVAGGTAISALLTSAPGIAIDSSATATTGNTIALSGSNASTTGIGMYGLAFASSGNNYGVVGESTSNTGVGVLGRGFKGAALGGASIGVLGKNYGQFGDGVRGDVLDIGTYGIGVRGYCNSGMGYGVFANGDLGATGVKSFVQPHPADAGKEIRFVCLEGNESGTYFRGTATLIGGQAVVEVPEEFRLVSEAEGLTVQISPRGPGRLWIESLDLEQLVVRGDARGFDYFVNGVRRGFADIDLVRENHRWVPEERGVPYGTQYPAAVRQILVENGTLNADFTPNEATAAAHGWVLRDPDPEPAGPLAARRAGSE